MEAKKYKRIPWDELLKNDQETIALHQHAADLKPNHKKVFCKLCSGVIIIKRVSRKNYNDFWSVAEQRHVDTELHKYNVLLKKLEGE